MREPFLGQKIVRLNNNCINNNNKISSVAGDVQDVPFSFQHISITIQCFNLMLSCDSFTSNDGTEN